MLALSDRFLFNALLLNYIAAFTCAFSFVSQSLKSRGYVKEQFSWQHYYWYLTNDGNVTVGSYNT